MTPSTAPGSGSLDSLATMARERAGLEDLGDDSWREGLQLMVDIVESTPGVAEEGRATTYRQVVEALFNRLRVVDHVKHHPEVVDERIERPLVILGLPRTGTTVASYLLDQDPRRRSLLNWEAADSIPPPTTDTLRSDPRCLARKTEIDELARALEAAQFPIPHWEEADGPTECTFLHNQDFKAFYWEAFMPTTAYADWLLTTDLASAYAYERTVLQILQSRAPGTWSLKMPSHAVHIEALLAAFPDVRIVWAHRDPYKVVGSYLSMTQLSRAQLLPDPDMAAFAPSAVEVLRAHVDRPLAARRRLGDGRFYDLHYGALLRDPIGEIRRLYEWAGDQLTSATERAMRGWLERNPQDRFGRRSYSLDAYGLSVADLRPAFDEYVSTFDIELEAA